jgi:transposase InsO family protein
VSDRYAFIDAEYATSTAEGVAHAPTITQMCAWLEVSKSGFYEWRSRPASLTAKRREMLKIKIAALFQASGGTYGYRRLHAALVRSGEQAGAELVRRLMRELDLVACQPRPWRTTTVQGAQQRPVPDLVARDFTAHAPGEKLVGDVTYIRTWEGWLYLATVIDCFSREIIGYAMGDHHRAELVIDALAMAERNRILEAGCIFHSDRGSEYTSSEFAKKLTDLGLRQSLGRTGICFDNALAESFFGALKNERVHRTVYPTRRHAERDIARYIEIFYNRQRLHSGLGYRTPYEVRVEYLNRKLAA